MTVPFPSIENDKKSTSTSRPNTTRGLVNYINRPINGETLRSKVIKKDDGRIIESNMTHTEVEVEVNDIRTSGREFTLEKEGFSLQKLNVPTFDWGNEDEIKKHYYPEAERVIKQVTGATRVHIFDATVRNGHIKPPAAKGDNNSKKPGEKNGPVSSVHVDYDQLSGIDRLDALLPEEADKLRETPFAVIQVWKPLKGPVRSSPLGVIDASTVERKDMTTKELHFPDRLGRNWAIHHNPNHKWWYASGINVDEAYLFVCYDSRKDRARFTPHSGFKDLSVGEDAPPRESVELRTYVFWEDLPAHKADREF